MIPAARAVLLTAALTHVLHDGFSDALYVLLPLWATEFRLTLTQVGVLKAAYTGGMALSQVPAGLLAERWGSGASSRQGPRSRRWGISRWRRRRTACSRS